MEGFIYIWRDNKRKKFYIGSRKGTIDDGYICSNKRMKCAYKNRPRTFTRRILEHVTFENHRELLARENYWLNFIEPHELGVRYYNEKKVAAGGDIVSTLPEIKRKAHKEKSIAARTAGHKKWINTLTAEEKSQRAKHARSKVKNLRGDYDIGEQVLKRSLEHNFMTPLGPRAFLNKAAVEFGISYPTLKKRIDNAVDGFYWIKKSSYHYSKKEFINVNH